MPPPPPKSIPSATRLGIHLAVWVGLLIAAHTGVTLAVVHHVFATATPSAADDLAWVARAAAADVARRSAASLATGDLEHLRSVSGTYAEQPDIASITARTTDGALHQVLGPPVDAPGGPFAGPPDSPRFLEDAVVTWTTADLAGEPVGAVAVAVATDRLTAWSRLRHLTLLVLLAGCAGAIAIAVAYSRLFVGPILRLSERSRRELAALNATLEARVADRTAQLQTTNERLAESLAQLQATQARLVDASRSAGKAEVAIEVLHNVGNVLSSVNTSAQWVAARLRRSPLRRLVDVCRLIPEDPDEARTFWTENPKARSLPRYLLLLATQVEEERATILGELAELEQNVEHINIIISTQQSHAAGAVGVIEKVDPASVLEDALRLHRGSLEQHGVAITWEAGDAPEILVDRHRLFQVLVNLVSNARNAILEHDGPERGLILGVHRCNEGVRFVVRDTGMGIHPDHIAAIFQHGFTTRADGHGFGLHDAANAAAEMGGRLEAQSDGPGCGATFTLTLPLAARIRPDLTPVTVPPAAPP